MSGDGITGWFEEWGRLIAAVDYAGARALFRPDVVGFGTFQRTVSGLDALEAGQWRAIWGAISGFTFHTAQLVSGVSGDGCTGWGACPWSSTGYHEDGGAFDRPGRATVLLARATPADPWLGVHTHISLAPGTPQRTFGAGV